MKNPFKKQSAIDTLINVGVGGAANVAVDYLINQVDAIKSLGDTTVNLIKIAGGAVVGSMISNKYARLACDGVATVGVSNLISSFMDEPSPAKEGANGLPHGTIGQVRPGVAAYKRARSSRVSGVNAGAVMGK